MRIFAVSPIPLTKDSWDRGITLIYRGLETLGVESQCVRLNTTDGAGFPGVIQTTMENMCSADWWKQHELDALVINSWGSPKYTPIIQAAKDAGIKVLARLDTNGINTPFLNPLAYTQYNYSSFRDKDFNSLKALFASMVKTPLYAIPSVYDMKHLKQLEIVDFIGVESPEAHERLTRMFKYYKRNHLIEKLAIIRQPAAPDIIATNIEDLPEKQKSIIAVGRWNAHQKNTPLLVKTIVETLKRKEDYELHLIGSGQDIIQNLLRKAPEDVKSRIHIYDSIPHTKVVEIFQRSQICLITSRYESGPLVASEALCCGCTFFAQDNDYVPLKAIRDLNAGGGTKGSAKKLASGLILQMEDWNAGKYDSKTIASKSRDVFAYTKIAEEVLKLFNI